VSHGRIKISSPLAAATDHDYERLRAHFDEGEVVEICLVAGLFAYFNLVNNALRTEPTR
jgi:alkylhydroperoxidase family enzyme